MRECGDRGRLDSWVQCKHPVRSRLRGKHRQRENPGDVTRGPSCHCWGASLHAAGAEMGAKRSLSLTCVRVRQQDARSVFTNR